MTEQPTDATPEENRQEIYKISGVMLPTGEELAAWAKKTQAVENPPFPHLPKENSDD